MWGLGPILADEDAQKFKDYIDKRVKYMSITEVAHYLYCNDVYREWMESYKYPIKKEYKHDTIIKTAYI